MKLFIGSKNELREVVAVIEQGNEELTKKIGKVSLHITIYTHIKQ